MRVARIAIPALMMSLAVNAIYGQAGTALDDVATAMGGKDRVLAVRTLIVEGTGELLYFGQTVTPYAKTLITLTSFRRSYDFANRRWLLAQTRESRYLKPMPPPLHARFGIDGDVAHNTVGDGAMARASASVAVDRSAEFIYHPIGFLQAAYDPANQVREDSDEGLRRIRLTVGVLTYTMRLDRRTNLPTEITRSVDHQMLGDVTLHVEFSEWRDASQLKLPMRIVQRQDRFTLSDYYISSVRTNAEVGNIAATDSIRAASPVVLAIEPAFPVDVEEAVPGVWLLTGPPFNGGLYHTIAIEQSDKIVLVEATENDARTLATLAKARELRPSKPLGPLVNTHHHFDHAGGVRAAISQSLTIITHEGNQDFFERVVYPGHHTIQPDALARNPKPLVLRSVRGKLVLPDASRPIELYEVKGSSHAGSLLVAYLPAERILIQADLEDSELAETIKGLGLNVQLVIGVHGRPIPWPPR